MKNIDLVGTALRWNQVVYSRKYSVPRPNALWHIDGHHKLIHWRLVLHACKDGYSRLPSFTNIVLTTKRSMFTGKSVHNFRVALLHRDVYIGGL